MNAEQTEYISMINHTDADDILIKKTGWEEISLASHAHNKHQIIYTLSGTIHVVAGENNYFVPERRLVWIPANMEHELYSNSCQVSLVIFYLSLDKMYGHAKKMNLSVYNTNALVAENLKFIIGQGSHVSKKDNSNLYWFILGFFNLLPQMSPETEFLFKTVVVPNDSRLYPVIKYIEQHISEDLRLDQLATCFGLSVRSLSRMFSESGLHFSSYLNHLRIMRAVELLTDGNESIQEIAYDTGFSSPSSFNRVFKQIVGTSPRQLIVNNEEHNKSQK